MRLWISAGILVLSAAPAWACSVCFGNPASPLTQALNYGIMTLLVFIIGVLASLTVFFFKMHRRMTTHSTELKSGG